MMKKRALLSIVLVCIILTLAAFAANCIPADRGCIAKRYITALGWTCAKDAEEVKRLTIPSSFDNVYADYNALQQQAGFDLTPYRGREVTSYTYRTTGNGSEQFLIHILMYDSKIIGGDIMSAALDGFMLPLMKRKLVNGTIG